MGEALGYWEASGKSDDWYTPQCVFDALGCEFDLDVAAGVGSRVPCKGAYFTQGLESAWTGFVWMNPPFGGRNGIAPWLTRFILHGNGIALTPDRTSAPWFQDAFGAMDAVLFTRKLRFVRPDGSEGKSPSNGTALMAIGWQGVAALHRAAEAGFGVLAHPAKVRR
jgi:hypothetical protein